MSVNKYSTEVIYELIVQPMNILNIQIWPVSSKQWLTSVLVISKLKVICISP